jgi:hypothetical protein
MRTYLFFIIICFLGLNITTQAADSVENKDALGNTRESALAAKNAYSDLLLQLNGVHGVGAKRNCVLNNSSLRVHCVVLYVESQSEIRAIESVFKGPLKLNGIPVTYVLSNRANQ